MIRAAILRRPDLRYRQRKLPVPIIDLDVNPYLGFCYIATKAFCEMVPEARPWCSDNGSHYWAMIGDEMWDLTAEQFDGADRLASIYRSGRKTKFNHVCRRTRELLAEAERGTRLTSAA